MKKALEVTNFIVIETKKFGEPNGMANQEDEPDDFRGKCLRGCKESVDPIGDFKNKGPVFMEEPVRQIVIGVNKINI